ncbi:MAG TPA: sigma-70 family RNA polymerase sigma factor [Fimbriimonadaceae bacterium]|nr:sigma-70 family RNA polymerase sigma factor [Fimbriimonadaceae bacterium]
MNATITASHVESGSFDQLMEATYRKVYNMAYRLAGNRSDAEDLTQETFVRAYRKFDDYQGDRPFENWVFRILTRLFLDLLRSRRRRVRASSLDAPIQKEAGDDAIQFDVADDRPNPEALLLNHQLDEDLQTVLSSLSPDQRMLITLADVEEVPYQEIAEMMGKPIGTIRSRLHRTHKLMRQRLEKIREERSKRARCGCSRLCAC